LHTHTILGQHVKCLRDNSEGTRDIPSVRYGQCCTKPLTCLQEFLEVYDADQEWLKKNIRAFRDNGIPIKKD